MRPALGVRAECDGVQRTRATGVDPALRASRVSWRKRPDHDSDAQVVERLACS